MTVVAIITGAVIGQIIGRVLYRKAIGRLRDECKNLASLLMSEYVWVHESIVPEVDKALEAYIGDKHDAPTEPASTS